MTRLSIRHETLYAFAAPVWSGPWRLMMRPADTHAIRVISANLELTPPGRTLWSYDAYGNSVCEFTPEGPASLVGVVNNLVIDRFPAPLAPQAYDPRSTLPIAYDEADAVVLAPFIAPAGPASRALIDWVVAHAGAPGALALHALQALNSAIHQRFDYSAREEPGVQTPEETLARGAGTCRDFAWLMIETARRLGFAARFVTGYLYSPIAPSGGRDVRGAGATHAWCEVFLPDLGWIEFDPTNGLTESPDLIRVAATRTPEEASPMRGGAEGGAVGELTVSVQVDLIG